VCLDLVTTLQRKPTAVSDGNAKFTGSSRFSIGGFRSCAQPMHNEKPVLYRCDLAKADALSEEYLSVSDESRSD